MAIEVQIDEDKPEDNSLFSLKEVLYKLKSFEVPDFQREYVWDKNKVELFFRDFNSLKEEDNKRFMGVVLYEKEGGRNSKLLDGQQRILTAILSFAAAIEVVSSGHRSELYSIAGGFAKAHPDNSEYSIDIDFKNCESHADDCINILSNAPAEWKETRRVSKNEYQTIKRMKENYLFFIHEYEKYDVSKRDEEVCSFIKKVFDNSQFLMIKTDNLREAFTLFESLNYRGVSLRSFELINNYFLNRYSNDKKRKKHSKEWDTIKNNIVSSGTESIYDKLLEVFWYCYEDNKATTDDKPGDWYDAYISLIGASAGTELEMVSVMKSTSEIVRSLYDKNYDFSKSTFIDREKAQQCEIFKHVHMFRTLDYNSIVVPLYVASLLYPFDYQKISKLFDKIEAYCIRNMWVCKDVTKSEAIKQMNKLARTLVKGKDIDKIIGELNEKLVPDSVFIDKFLVFEPKVSRENSADSRKIKLLFSRIFDIEGLSSMDSDFAAYSIEHICALKDKCEYSIIPENRNRFGNITVMSTSKNRDLKRDPYYEKIKVYQTDPVLCSKCIEDICFRYSKKDITVLDYKVLSNIKPEDLKKVDDNTYWSQGEEGCINGKTRFSIWADYLSEQFRLNWPKEIRGGDEKIDSTDVGDN